MPSTNGHGSEVESGLRSTSALAHWSSAIGKPSRSSAKRCPSIASCTASKW
jgi:hypothetical protein